MKKTLLLISSILSITAASAQIPTSGMIAGWTFDGNANDVSGNGHNGIVTGATLTANRIGTPNAAYSFNGTGNYIRVPSTSSLTPANMTICAEVRPMGFYSGNCQGNEVICKGGNYTTGSWEMIFTDNHYDGSCAIFDSLHEDFKGDFSTNTSANANYLYTPYVVSGTWYCVATTFDGSTIKTYIDGTLKTTITATNALVGDTNSIYIGAYGWDLVQFPYWFKGVIDDIHLYNRVLTPTEISGYCSVLAGIDSPGSIASHVSIANLGNGMFEVKLDKAFNKVQVNVSSVLGQSVYASSDNISTTHILNLSSFAKGVYLVNVVTEDGTYSTKIINQ